MMTTVRKNMWTLGDNDFINAKNIRIPSKQKKLIDYISEREAEVDDRLDDIEGTTIDGVDFTKIMTLPLDKVISSSEWTKNAGFHNSIFRGKYLGSSYTEAQRTAIQSGTFDDLFIGDYWTIGGIDYVICHFDYYYRCSDADINYHHVIVMPRGTMTGLSVTRINSETDGTYQWCSGTANSTAGGYIASRMRTVIMPACDVKVKSAFGSSYVHAISELYPSKFASETDVLAKGWAWTSTDLVCDLLNETMVYGHQVWGVGSEHGNAGYEVGIDKWQLAIFRLDPQFANIRSYWWLRSVASASYAARAGHDGKADDNGAANAFRVRPRFVLS